MPLAGIPVKAAAEYLRRLVGQGHRVAMCEQVEDPKLAKGLVKREVIETITPGAAFADDLLDGARANYVCAIATGRDTARDGDRAQMGIAAADLSTGELRLALVRGGRCARGAGATRAARIAGGARRVRRRAGADAARGRPGAGDGTRAVGVRRADGGRRTHATVRRARARRLRPGQRRRRGHRRGGCAAALSARAAAGRVAASGAPHRGARRRRDAARRDDAPQPRAGRVAARRRTGGHAAVGAGSHGDAHGRSGCCGSGCWRR